LLIDEWRRSCEDTGADKHTRRNVASHAVEPTKETLHGVFSRDFAPILTIDPGDTVVFRTLDAGWGIEGPEVPRRHFEPRLPDRGDGHALCGPVAVRGAKPGIMLEVRLKQIIPGPWGWTIAGGWDSPINRRLGIVGEGDHRLNWRLDVDRMIGRDQFGRTVPLKPFMGVMGLAPAEPRRASTIPPRREGGNIDCKELVAGTSLFLPIALDGALFSVGDGHAAQGDGEVSGMAIECPMDRVEIEFHLHDRPIIPTAHARLSAAWLTLGFSEDLNQATGDALEAMILLLQARHGLSKLDALALASVCVNMRITQIVNGVWGAHAVLSDDALRMPG
jgi:acetamidase/formamidase